MSQARIMKRRMTVSIIITIISLVAVFIFMGLYSDEKSSIQVKYMEQYYECLTEVHSEIDTYLSDGTDFDLHYNMILSDLGAARSFIFLMDNRDDRQNITDKQKIINELHYAFVKYPDQMSTKLKETDDAISDIVYGLDKGYDEVADILSSVNKMGT